MGLHALHFVSSDSGDRALEEKKLEVDRDWPPDQIPMHVQRKNARDQPSEASDAHSTTNVGDTFAFAPREHRALALLHRVAMVTVALHVLLL